jgi:hypothetical protein
MNNLKIIWGSNNRYGYVYTPEDNIEADRYCAERKNYSWFIRVFGFYSGKLTVEPSGYRVTYPTLYAIETPFGGIPKNPGELKAWLETAYALGELPVGEEKL